MSSPSDARDYAARACLMQSKGFKMHPVAYFSKNVNQVQHKYSTTEKEAVAIKLALKHFRLY